MRQLAKAWGSGLLLAQGRRYSRMATAQAPGARGRGVGQVRLGRAEAIGPL